MKKPVGKIITTNRAYLKSTLCLTLLVLTRCANNELTNEGLATTNDSLASDANYNTKIYHHQDTASLDSSLNFFFSDLENLEEHIHPQFGVYCIDYDSGSAPILERLKSKEDLMSKTPFMFMCRDIAIIKNKIAPNPSTFDPCNDENEGRYTFTVDQPLSVLQDCYKICKAQQGAELNEKEINELKKIDDLTVKSAVVSFKEKHGDLVILKLYFIKENNTLYLSVIDLNDCGT